MASDAQRYKAFSLNIAGFALMTPFSKMILNTFLDGLPQVTIGYLTRILVAFALLFFGIIFIAQGSQHLE